MNDTMIYPKSKFKCPKCKRKVIKLVPLIDSDQKHIKRLWCRDCKKAWKKYIKGCQ